MSQGHEYALSESSKFAPRSMVSNESLETPANPNPFSHPTDNLAENPSSHYDPAAGNLLANADQKGVSRSPLDLYFWAWEMAAWLLAAVSLITLFVVLVHFD